MIESQFTVILDRRRLDEADADRLYETCKDGALIAQGVAAFMDFDRRAALFKEAICTAVADVNSAGFRVERVEIEADSFAAMQAPSNRARL